MKEHIHVGVCIASTGSMSLHTAMDTTLMALYFQDHKIPGVKSQKLTFHTSVGSMLCQNRHSTTRAALKAGATHLLYLDCDMLFPRNLIHKFLLAEKDVIGANCTTRTEPVLPIAHRDWKRIYSNGKEGLEQVELVGLAVMMVRREVYSRISPPLFDMVWIPEKDHYTGEDAYFLAKVQDAGYEVFIDHDVSLKVKHIGEKIYGHEHVKEKK